MSQRSLTLATPFFSWGTSILGCLLFFLASCDPPPPETQRFTAVQSDFDTSGVSVKVPDGWELHLWAPGPLIRNAVAIDFDHQGAAYVTETQRRKSSDIDIRAHRDWMTEDIGLSSLAETEAFHKTKLAPELSEQNTWQEDFNEDGVHDWKDLTVQSEYIRKIWDSDGNGRADVSQIYAEGFNDLLTGIAAGILHQGGEVYMTAAPDLWKLTDENGDGQADKRRSLSKGYGIHIAYAGHDMSGLTMGPDGKVYWSIGDIGVNVTGPDGKEWAYPHEGAVMRCNPDGSEFEVFAHGLRNPQELAFDAYGNLISVDNDGDHPGEHERFVHILEGSDSGWRMYWQYGKYDEENEAYKIWMDERLSEPHFEGQAAYLLPPLALAPDGPAGLAFNPGTALGTNWDQYFFASYFTGSSARSKIQAFRLAPKGASFHIAEQTDVLNGLVSTGLAWGPDGALYLNDWLDGYQLKPEGRIWKLDVTTPHPLRAETQRLLAQGMTDRSLSQLVSLLDHADQRVRLEAQFELVKRQALPELEQAGQLATTLFGKLHAIWGLGQLARTDVELADKLLPFLQATEPQVRAQTAKVLGEVPSQVPFEQLSRLLVNDTNAVVQLHVAQAMGRRMHTDAFPHLLTKIAALADQDPHLRHVYMLALSRIAPEQKLAQLHSHASAAVRLAAVVALRHQGSARLQAYLDDPEPLVVIEAARAIHDDLSVPAALPALAQSLTTSTVTEEAFLRRAINANLRIGDAAAALRLAEFAKQSTRPLAMRQDALWALGYWERTPVLDRVEGRYRELPAHAPADAQAAFASVFAALTKSNQPEPLRQSVARAIGRLHYQAGEAQLKQWFSASAPLTIRQASLRSLVELESEYAQEAIHQAIASPHQALRADAQALMPQLHLPTEQIVPLLATALKKGSLPEQQQALKTLSGLTGETAEKLLQEWLKKLTNQSLPQGLALDVYLAAAKSPIPALNAQLDAYENQKNAQDPLEVYQESLWGGDIRKGQRLFYRNNSAQCIRCHQINGLGGEVGPDLTHIATVLTREELLASMVAPSDRLAPGYGTVMMTRKDGSKLVGVWLGQTDNLIRYEDNQGQKQTISVTELSNWELAPSAMPAMQNLISRQEIRDLVAFISSLE